MAFSYTIDPSGIKYINIPSSGLKGLNYKPRYANNNFEYADQDGIKTFINAVELNWNGAQLKNGSTVKATLNTTGEMLSILQTAYNYATTYTGTTSLTSSSVLGTINGQSLKYGGSITINTGSNYTHPTFNGVTGSYGTSATKTLAHGGTFNVPYITVNNNGHITAVKSYTLTLPAAQTTITGNAGTATKLKTPITLKIGSTNTSSKSFDGSANVSWTLTDIGAAAADHTHSQYITKDDLTAKSYITTAVADGKYATKSHASTANTYGIGTSEKYGHLKISDAYTTQTSVDTALSLGGAHNLYIAFLNRINALNNKITSLETRVATLEGHHETKPVTAVTVTPKTYTFYGKGQTFKLTYSITPEDASNKSVTWSSGNETYASVNSEGVVTSNYLTSGFDNGYVMIKGTANDNPDIYGYCKVFVEEAHIVTVDAGKDITLTYGDSSIHRIVPRQTIKSGDGAVCNTGYTYVTSGSSVTVNNGVLTIVETGISEITVKSNADPTKSDVVTVTVNEATTYYWYAGWKVPTAQNIATIVNDKYPATNSDPTEHTAGGSTNDISTINANYVDNKLFDNRILSGGTKSNYYVVVPNGLSVYDILGTVVCGEGKALRPYSTFTNHTVYKSSSASVYINAIIIKK